MRAAGSWRRPRLVVGGTRAIVAVLPIDAGNPLRFGRTPALSRRAGALSGRTALVLLAGPRRRPAEAPSGPLGGVEPLREGV